MVHYTKNLLVGCGASYTRVCERKIKITYCPGHLSEEEVKGAGFGYIPLEDALKEYKPQELKDDYNTIDEEEVFFVSNLALGL